MRNKIRIILALAAAAIMLAGCVLPGIAGAAKQAGEVRKDPSLDMDFSFIRVLISTGDSSKIELDLVGEYRIGTTALNGTESSPKLIRVSASSGGVKITDRSSGYEITSGTSVELIRLHDNYEAGYAQLTLSGNSDTQDRYYLGSFRFYAESGHVRMINTVHLAYYIYGIVGYELSTSSQPEALKAQAVAAKTMGMYYMGGDGDWDVKDGWTSAVYQAYRGFRENRLVTMPYCIAVIGEALSYNGSIIPIFYAHTNGGETSLPSTVFGSSLSRYDGAYAVSLDDIEINDYPSYKETVSVDFGGTGDNSRFLDFILGKARAAGTVSNRVVSIDDLYAYDAYPGTQRDMRKLYVEATLEVSGEDGEPQNVPFVIDCASNELRSLVLSDYDGSGDNYSTYKYAIKKNLKLYWGTAREGGYTLIAARYGHGVGMSQIGADLRANPDTYGWDYRQILAFYYPGMELISITEDDPSDASGPNVNPMPILAYAECTDDNTNFRMGASTSYPSMGKVQTGEHLDILGVTETGWFHAIWNGLTGYITMDYSQIVMFPAPTDGIFTVTDGATKSSANLRSEPYIRDGNVITKLPKDTVIKAWAQIGKWLYVTTDNGYRGFLSNVVTNIYGTHTETGMSSIPVPPRDLPHMFSPVAPPRAELRREAE